MWKWEDQMGSNYSWQGEGLWWYRWRRGERVTQTGSIGDRADWTCWWRWEGQTFRATLQPKPERLDGCWLSATEVEDTEGAKVFMRQRGAWSAFWLCTCCIQVPVGHAARAAQMQNWIYWSKTQKMATLDKWLNYDN